MNTFIYPFCCCCKLSNSNPNIHRNLADFWLATVFFFFFGLLANKSPNRISWICRIFWNGIWYCASKSCGYDEYQIGCSYTHQMTLLCCHCSAFSIFFFSFVLIERSKAKLMAMHVVLMPFNDNHDDCKYFWTYKISIFMISHRIARPLFAEIIQRFLSDISAILASKSIFCYLLSLTCSLLWLGPRGKMARGLKLTTIGGKHDNFDNATSNRMNLAFHWMLKHQSRSVFLVPISLLSLATRFEIPKYLSVYKKFCKGDIETSVLILYQTVEFSTLRCLN